MHRKMWWTAEGMLWKRILMKITLKGREESTRVMRITEERQEKAKTCFRSRTTKLLHSTSRVTMGASWQGDWEVAMQMTLLHLRYNVNTPPLSSQNYHMHSETT